jgi:hypothetical protein
VVACESAAGGARFEIRDVEPETSVDRMETAA